MGRGSVGEGGSEGEGGGGRGLELGEGGGDGFEASAIEAERESLAGLSFVGEALDLKDFARPPLGLGRVDYAITLVPFGARHACVHPDAACVGPWHERAHERSLEVRRITDRVERRP